MGNFALGTIVSKRPNTDSKQQIYLPIFDYYDHWSEIDPRLQKHYDNLSRCSAIFAKDVINLATYTREVIEHLPGHVRHCPSSVVSVGSMTEAFFVSLRSAYDALAIGLGYVAPSKVGQAPQDSLNSLIKWLSKNSHRSQIDCQITLTAVPDEFSEIRRLRDGIIHRGDHVTIHCDTHQFNLWITNHDKWRLRTPLLPLLSRHWIALSSFSNFVAHLINDHVSFPHDRVGSRAIEGVFVPSLRELKLIQSDYARPSP